MTNKKLAIGLAVVAIVAIIGLFTPAGRIVTNTVHETLSGITNYDSLTLSEDLIVGDDMTIAGDINVSAGGELVNNGQYSYVSSGSCADATTTLFAVANPFSATSTVDLVIYNTTGEATSTYSLFISTSTTAYVNKNSAEIEGARLLSRASIATSTRPYLITGGNTSTYSTSDETPTNSASRIIVGPAQYIVGFATSSNVLAPDWWEANGKKAFTSTENSAACTYTIRWIK